MLRIALAGCGRIALWPVQVLTRRGEVERVALGDPEVGKAAADPPVLGSDRHQARVDRSGYALHVAVP